MGEPLHQRNISEESSFSNLNLGTFCSIWTDVCWCNYSLFRQGEPFFKRCNMLFNLRFHFYFSRSCLIKYPSSDSVRPWHTPLELVARPLNGFPTWLFLFIHRVQVSINSATQNNGEGGWGGNTATAWSLGSDQNRPECWTVIGTQLLLSNSF